MDKKNYKAIFAISLIFLGIIINFIKLKTNNFLGFNSVGDWLLYVGILSIILTIFQSFSKKEKKVDERMIFIANKANKITFLFVIIFAFITMILDGINTITIPYNLFMSYFICTIVLVHLISYKLMLKYY